MNDKSDDFSTYCLHIQITKDITIEVGKLGQIKFPKGIYLYCGSAKRNFNKRIERHQSKIKKNHWHIDYLLSNKFVKIIEIYKFKQDDETECSLVDKFIRNDIAHSFYKGFGSSDCKNGCHSHLLKLL